MKLSWGAFYALLFAYRSAVSVLALTVVSALTPLSDSASYQVMSPMKATAGALGAGDGVHLFSAFEFSLSMQIVGNLITEAVAALFHFLSGGNPVAINLGFQAIAFIGLWRLLEAVDAGTRRYLAILLMLPSFTLWTSIASKEAIVVFLVCMIARYVVELYKGTARFGLHHALFLALLYIYKPHFIPAILFLIVVPKVAAWVRQPSAVALLAGLASLVPLYSLRVPISAFVFDVVQNMFGEPGGSTRAEPFLTEPSEFFLKAPEGMWRSFMGPTFSEASSGILHLAAYLESLILVALLLAWVVPRIPRMPVYLTVIGAFTLFWILLPNYPLGLANPGTAVRYRTDYVVIVYLAAVLLSDRLVFVHWRAARRGMRVWLPRRSAAGLAQAPASSRYSAA